MCHCHRAGGCRRWPGSIPIALTARGYEGPGSATGLLAFFVVSALLRARRTSWVRDWDEAFVSRSGVFCFRSLARNLVAVGENRLNNAGHSLLFERVGAP